jgi:hypothetical protein
MDKLYKWIDLNLKTIPHIHMKGVDPDWIQEN